MDCLIYMIWKYIEKQSAFFKPKPPTWFLSTNGSISIGDWTIDS